ncbi:hypothetical protein ACSBL2_18400 [Pedobacter sp. AW31-3R]|uniref:hypothetical protein n=1 Tax=Pedobacter sp. AW31-3R TaxID=3445781 RepID=UPI003F9EEB61
MQATHILKPSEELLTAITQDKAFKYELLIREVEEASLQIAYMLQLYYSREKVSGVHVIPGSVKFEHLLNIRLKAGYRIEEFNACSAIDTLNQEQMILHIDCDIECKALHLSGEYWPEREPD